MKITLKSCLVIAVVSLIFFCTTHVAGAQKSKSFPDRTCLTSITRPNSTITSVINPKVKIDVEAFSSCYLGRFKTAQAALALETYTCGKNLMIEIGNGNIVDGTNWQVLDKGIREFLSRNYPKLKIAYREADNKPVYEYKILYNKAFNGYNAT